ncbi:MAG: hypothetical protein JOZ05_11565 [Acetobacteraceae bacterium]|nr:hypothetical protein [Acetobacteraceae bacterium]
MPLSFQNLYTETTYVALLWFDPGCSPDPWRKIGWYEVPPGQTVEVVGDDLRTLADPNFAWFVDTGADGPCWSGDRWYRVPHNAAFDQCYDDDTGCNALWPFIAGTLDTEWIGFTIMLLAPGNPDQSDQGCAWGSPQYPQPIEIADFYARPSAVRPDESATLLWNVLTHGDPSAAVTLNGSSVPFNGSESVGVGTYTLNATTLSSSDSRTVEVFIRR